MERSSRKSKTKGAARYALTLAEERDVIRRAQEGDAAAMERITEAYRPLVCAAAHRRAAEPFAEDARQAAAEELVRTVYAYDLGKPYPFGPYAKIRVHGAVSHLLNKNVRSWQRECTAAEAEDFDRLPDERAADALAAADARATLAPLLAVLTDEERKALRLLYGRGLTTRAAAAALGCSQSKVYRLKREALEKMRKKAATRGETDEEP